MTTSKLGEPWRSWRLGGKEKTRQCSRFTFYVSRFGEPLDLFDRLYFKWASTALDRQRDPPKRERWDEIVLFLLMSKDPLRMARYRRMESDAPGSLGNDAYDLWKEMPDYMLGSAKGIKTQPALKAYAEAHQGTMRQLMEGRGLLELYDSIIAKQAEIEQERRARARRGQTNIMIIGCAGMAAILIMMLIVFTIILFKLL